MDVILFNPPYVPTLSSEAADAQRACGIDAALSGGTDGMEVTNSLLHQIPVRIVYEDIYY
jgi:release factor glutamine methyltransferase